MKELNLNTLEELLIKFNNTGGEHIILNPYLSTPTALKKYTNRYTFYVDCGINMMFPEQFFKRLNSAIISGVLGEQAVVVGTEDYIRKYIGDASELSDFYGFFKIRTFLEKETGREIRVIFDNFQDCLKFEKFYGQDQFLSNMNKIQSEKNLILFLNILSTNQILSLLENLVYIVRPFTKLELTSYLNKNHISILQDHIFEITQGNPFLIDFISGKIPGLKSNYDEALELGFSIFYERMLSELSGDISFKSIFLIFASKDGLKLNEIAGYLDRKPGVIQTYLNRLLNYKVIRKDDKVYYFQYPEILMWLRRNGIVEVMPELKKESKKQEKIPSKPKEKKEKVQYKKPEFPDYF
ncbi:MAG: hypothetical protein PHV06_00850 [bacterium]|nr:hypothetical protein [bacterium]